MIKVLFFAHLKDLVGTSELSLEVENITAKELKQILEQKYSITFENYIMIAVNEEYAHSDVKIQNGDTVALIPPVSGG